MLPAGIDFNFNDHRNLAHNPLYYLYFIMSIWHQARSEDTSIEIYVRKCIMNGDVHWFPTGVLHEVPAIEEKRAELMEIEDDKKGGGGGHHPTHQVTEAGGGGGHGHGGGGHGGHGGGHDDGKHKKRQTSFLRKSLVFQPETQGNASSGMEELMDKMTNMQKQIMKLSKDIYAGRDRANSQPTYSFEMSTTSPGVLNTSVTASAHGSDPNTPSALIRKQIPPPPTTQPDSDSYSSSGYSSTSDSENEADDADGERKEEGKDDEAKTENKGLKSESMDRPSPLNLPALKNGGLSPRRTNISSQSIQSFLASTPKSPTASSVATSSKKLKREGTRNSQLTVGSGKKKKKNTIIADKQLLEFNSDLKSKVERLDTTLQLIMKKLEEMETGNNNRSSRQKSNPLEPEVSSNDTPKNKNLPSEEYNNYSELSDHSNRDPYPKYTESKKKKTRPQSAHPTTSSLQIETTSNGLDDLDLSPIHGSKKNKQRPQSAHPYNPEIAAQMKSPTPNLNISLSNPFMLQPQELIDKIKKHKAKSQQKYKEKDRSEAGGNKNVAFAGPPKALVTNLWVGNNSPDQLTEGYNSSLDK